MNVAIIGSSGGIGSALVKRLSDRNDINRIYTFSRRENELENDFIQHGYIDLTDENSIKTASESCEGKLDLIIVATGMLHDGDNLPEKSLRDLNYNSMQACFAVNTIGPALVAKYFLPLLKKDERSVFAVLSARVGSISDNGIGGWYSYRASKAALNMIVKNAAIEMGRRYKKAVIIGLHPGTVDTALSEPFQRNVSHEIFTPQKAATYLLDVMHSVNPSDSGKCFAWDGQEIEP